MTKSEEWDEKEKSMDGYPSFKCNPRMRSKILKHLKKIKYCGHVDLVLDIDIYTFIWWIFTLEKTTVHSVKCCQCNFTWKEKV